MAELTRSLSSPPTLIGGGDEATFTRPPRPAGAPTGTMTAPAVVLTLLVTLLFLMFVWIEPTPRWIVLFGTGVVALSADGVLRGARSRSFARSLDTVPFLFLPSLYVLAAPVFIEHNVGGFAVVPLALLGGLGFGVLLAGQIGSVREREPGYLRARFLATAATYFVAFALFSLTFSFELDARPGIVAAGLIALMLSVELLREGEADPLETLVLAAVVGVLLAESRLVLHYLPLEGHLAALTLLLVLFVASGIVQAHLTRQLGIATAAQHVGIGAVGIALVAAARLADIA